MSFSRYRRAIIKANSAVIGWNDSADRLLALPSWKRQIIAKRCRELAVALQGPGPGLIQRAMSAHPSSAKLFDLADAMAPKRGRPRKLRKMRGAPRKLTYLHSVRKVVAHEKDTARDKGNRISNAEAILRILKRRYPDWTISRIKHAHGVENLAKRLSDKPRRP
jgi:hypothetical protein